MILNENELALVGLAFTLITGFWAIGKMLIMQFEKRMDERFEGMSGRFSGIEDEFKEIARLDRDLSALRIEMMREYVRVDALEKLETKITEGFASLFQKLDNKVSKSACAKTKQQC